MRIITQNAGGEADEYDNVLEAGFAEGPTDSDLVMLFQRELSAGTWEGDPNTDDYFSNSYCITLRSGETVYGGLEQVVFFGNRGTFSFSDRAAQVLGTGRQVVVDFQVPERNLWEFQETLKKVVTWGVPSQIPQLMGFPN
ncbi:hypothetical protein IFM51744_08218 [Aspergillus udagawae]|nr:hypothetical protein IFM51744_08218 [Aspergillus udagawae]